MPTSKIPTALVLMGLALIAHAQSRFEQDFEDATKPWQEIALQLPAAPKAENLVPFYVSPSTSLSFAIDAKSLTVNSDGVVRYTLITKSPSGAENISYEGIRCETYEVKLYAIGHSDGKWARSRRDKWTVILDKPINRQHAALALDYFCDQKSITGDERHMLDQMRWHRPSKP